MNPCVIRLYLKDENIYDIDGLLKEKLYDTFFIYRREDKNISYREDMYDGIDISEFPDLEVKIIETEKDIVYGKKKRRKLNTYNLTGYVKKITNIFEFMTEDQITDKFVDYIESILINIFSVLGFHIQYGIDDLIIKFKKYFGGVKQKKDNNSYKKIYLGASRLRNCFLFINKYFPRIYYNIILHESYNLSQDLINYVKL
jgi:hypothetical protein